MSKWRPEDDEQLVEDLAGFANDPLGFAMYAYPWLEEGTPLEHVPGPRGWQAEVLQDIGHHTANQEFCLANDLDLAVYREATASGRGIGKSALFGIISNWQTSCHIGSSVVVTANTEMQLRSKTFPEFARWYTMAINSHWWQVDGLKVHPQDWIAALVAESLKVGTDEWGVFGTPWSAENPDAYAGKHNSYGLSVFFDEASGIPAKIWDVTEGFFTEKTAYRQWIAFSQGRRNSGAFYDRFHKAEYRQFWKTRQIDARTVEGSDQSVFNQMVAVHGEDSDVVRVEVRGLFPEASEMQFISHSLVRDAQVRPLPPGVDFAEPLIMGVDPAPRGRTCIRFRRGRNARTVPPVILNGADNVQIVNKIIQLCKLEGVDAIAVDAGLGTGVIDILKSHRWPVHEVWFGAKPRQSREWATLGTELWAEVRDWLPGGMIDDSPRLMSDLTSRHWKWFGREEAQKILESKKDMAKEGIPSPDDADALCLTFYPRMPRKDAKLQRHRDTSMFQSSTPIAQGVDENPFGL